MRFDKAEIDDITADWRRVGRNTHKLHIIADLHACSVAQICEVLGIEMPKAADLREKRGRKNGTTRNSKHYRITPELEDQIYNCAMRTGALRETADTMGVSPATVFRVMRERGLHRITGLPGWWPVGTDPVMQRVTMAQDAIANGTVKQLADLCGVKVETVYYWLKYYQRKPKGGRANAHKDSA